MDVLIHSLSLLVGDVHEPLLIDQEMPQKWANFFIVGSVNGLILFYYLDDCSYFLRNPAMRQHRCLSSPPPTKVNSKRDIVFMGFGFHPQINVYKLVQVLITESANENFLTAEVLALGSDSWKTVNKVPPFRLTMPHASIEDSVCVNGVLYAKVSEDLPRRTPQFILSFDLRDEVFQKLEFPHDNPRKYRMGKLIVYNGLLAMVEANYSYWEIWALKNDCWCKFVRIRSSVSQKVLGIWRNTHVVMMDSNCLSEEKPPDLTYICMRAIGKRSQPNVEVPTKHGIMWRA